MQQFQLSIPEPCHESWQHMTPTEQGRFCNACAKEVVDFSMMTDDEVLNYFNTLTHEKVCGRALPSQLDRAITAFKAPVKKRFWYWNYITMFFLLFSKNSTAKPHGGILITPLHKSLRKSLADTVFFTRQSAEAFMSNKIIAGKITNEDGKGIPFVIVKVKGTNRMVTADEYGVYSIKVNVAADVLEISASGYGNKILMLSGLQTFNFSLSKSADVIPVTVGMMIKKEPFKKGEIKQQHDAIRPIIISGKVIDKNGAPVPYASIKTKNSNKGTSADSAGVFSLETEYTDALIECTALGYTPKIIMASEIETAQHIVLEKAPEITLQPVIVNTYGTTRVLMGMMGGISVTRGRQVRSLPDTLRTVVAFKKSSVSVYPNPVTRGNSFNLAVQLKQPGYYNIKISSAGGSIILMQPLMISSKSQVVKIMADSRWSAGIYFLSVTDKNNKIINTSSFSVQ